MKPSGYCLFTPSGKVVADTFDTDHDVCWAKSFEYLYETKKWMSPYWKRWDDSVEAAKKRGWEIKTVNVVRFL